jgi:hypothetical protein
MAEATYNVLSEFLQKCCKKSPKKSFNQIAETLLVQFEAGYEEQGASYSQQKELRNARWKALMPGGPTFAGKENDDDPWRGKFEAIAGTVKPPKAK